MRLDTLYGWCDCNMLLNGSTAYYIMAGSRYRRNGYLHEVEERLAMISITLYTKGILSSS